MFKEKVAKKFCVLAAKEKGEVVEWTKPLFRGIKETIENFKPDNPNFSGPKYYGKGVYFHISPSPASDWIGQEGIVVQYKPKRPLRLLSFASPVERKNHLKDLPDDIDGVFLASRNQEAGQQIILKSADEVKPSYYWPYKDTEHNWEHLKQLDPKLKKRIRGR